jgi:S1-C subfamily serine protease
MVATVTVSMSVLLVVACTSPLAIAFQPGGAMAAVVPTFTSTPLPLPTATPTGTPTATQPAEGLDIAERRIIDVYERVAPSVVNVTTRVLRRSFFFDVVPEEGAGSGFVLDQDGHILTNFHVVDGAERIQVSFSDETMLDATVVGADARNDIAVLKVDAPAGLLAPVELGSSTGLRVGQRAIAIGNPFGQFGRTLTTGVVSALDRTLEGDNGHTLTGMIQTDAAINRGNSGGPLLDSSGRVIGITTAIFSPSGASAGVGLAVPVDKIRRLLPDLLTLGHYRHPWLGIRYAYAITPGLAEVLELPVSKGLLLVQLYEDSPLAQAGAIGAQTEGVIGNQRIFMGGDVLLAVDNVPQATVENLETFLEDTYQVGATVTVQLQRDDQPYEVTVVLAEEPN